MSEAPSSAPRRRRRWWLLLFLPVILLAALALGVWFLKPPDEPGVHVQLVLPGATTSMRAAGRPGGLQLELAPELLADNVQASLGALRFRGSQTFFVRREECSHDLKLTAGKQVIDTSLLRYQLFDNGKEISSGIVRPRITLQPGEDHDLSIADFGVQQADTIRLSLVPR